MFGVVPTLLPTVILLSGPTLAPIVGMILGQRGFMPHFRWANVVVTRVCCIFIGPTWVCTALPLGQRWANAYLFHGCFLLGQCVLVCACMRACVRACVETLNIGYIVYKQRAYNENIGLDC